jgi:triosephosphate isomerase
MGRPILTANWKMNKTSREASAFATELLGRIAGEGAVEVVIAPPFTALAAVAQAISGSEVLLAAQNVSPEPSGAFTGEISAPMLAEIGCAWGIVGHSERRHLFGEDDALVARKARALHEHGIGAIVCVGETLDQREAGRTLAVLGAQLEGSLRDLSGDDAPRLVVAYEPVWAIGTGRTADPETAQEAHAFIRQHLGQRFGSDAGAIRLQYGGSVTPKNVYALMAQPDIDGALVGGASLDPESFSRIVRFGSEGPAERGTT